MGNFLAATAVRTEPDAVAAAVEGFLAEHQAAAGAGAEGESAQVYAAGDDWSVVLWPAFFNVYDEPAAGRLSQTCDTLVSTVHLFDDDYWTHVLYDRGDQVDVFCSKPTYHLDGETDAKPLRDAFAGRPDLIGQRFGIESQRVAPYLRHTDVDNPPHETVAEGDEHGLDDTWVFTDFWRALGITYPVGENDPAARVTFAPGWQGLLPVGSVP